MKKSVLNAVILSLGIAALAVAGCGKDKKEGESKEQAAAGAQGGAASGAARPAGGSAKSAFALFPKESNLIAGVNVSALRGTALWKKFQPIIEQQGGNELKEFSAICGMDPFQSLDSFVVGGNTEDEDSMVVAVKGNLDRAKVLDCVKKIAAKEGEEVNIEEDGQIVGITAEGKTQYLAWLDDGTIVTGPKAEGNKEWLKGILSGGPSVNDNKDFMGLVNSTDSNASLWLAMVPPTEGDNPFAAMGGASPKAVFASIDMKTGLKVDAGLRYEKADDAKMMSEQANQMMGPMKADATFGKFLAKTSVANSGNDVVLKVDLNQGEFDELMGMLEKQLLPMLMMGGGM